MLPALGLKVALPKSGDPDPVHEPRRVTITVGKDAQYYDAQVRALVACWTR